MKKILKVCLLVLLSSFQIAWNEIDSVKAQTAGEHASNIVQLISDSGNIKVAAVQMHSSHSLTENVEKICLHLSECAKKNATLAVFPECATTGYFKDDIPKYSLHDYVYSEKTTQASRNTAKRSLEACFLNDFWNKGLEVVNDPENN